jgi:superfamily I DNA and RNA helicase
LENNKHWQDLGFDVEKGDSKDFEEMIISRSTENSPTETNEYFQEESIQIKVFPNVHEESNFIINQIENDIQIHRLRPDDICVICLDSKNIGGYFDIIEAGLLPGLLNLIKELLYHQNLKSFWEILLSLLRCLYGECLEMANRPFV